MHDDDLGALIDALRDAGLAIPDEVNTVADLVVAIRAQARGGNGGDDDLDLGDDLTADPTTGAPAMLMSMGLGPVNPPSRAEMEAIRRQRQIARRLSGKI